MSCGYIIIFRWPTCCTQTSTGQLVVLNKPQTSQLVVVRLQQANLWDSVIKFWPIISHGLAHSISLRFDHQFLTNHNSGFSSDQSGRTVQTSSSDQSRSMVQFTTSKNAASEVTTSKNASSPMTKSVDQWHHCYSNRWPSPQYRVWWSGHLTNDIILPHNTGLMTESFDQWHHYDVI